MPPQQGSNSENNLPFKRKDFQAPIKPKKSKKLIYVIISMISLVIVVVFVWFLLSKTLLNKSNSNVSQANTSDNNLDQNTNTEAKAIPTMEYSYGFLGLKLEHPNTWKISENDDSVSITSQSFDYETLEKGQIAGNFKIYIRKGARDVDGAYIGRGYAMQSSEKLIYSNPALGQLPETNLTLYGLDDSNNFAFFLIAGNFVLQKGDTLGPYYGKEPETYIIYGGFTDPSLVDDLATNPVNPEILKTSEAYKQAIDILETLQLR